MNPMNDGGAPAPLLVTIRPTAEVTIKAPRTRDTFLRKLRLAVKDALQRAGFATRVRVQANRVLAEVQPKAGEDAGLEEARAALARVFGVGSFSFLEATARPELDDIVAVGTELFAERVKGRRYAVRCKRNGRHAFSSMDVERKLGAALNPGAQVDLTHPEVTVEVEVGERRAHFFSERHPGPGGLPLGTGGHALALLSGGYDSIVAAWQLMRRGVEVDSSTMVVLDDQDLESLEPEDSRDIRIERFIPTGTLTAGRDTITAGDTVVTDGAASMLAEGAAYLPVLVTGVLINLRLALLSAALTPHVRRVPTATRPLLAQMLTDESFAVSMASFQRDGPDALFYLGSGLCIYAFWQAATALGYLFGAGLPGGLGLDYALPASLVALLFLLVRERRTAMVAGLAAAAAVLLRPLVSGAWATLLATLLVCTVGVVARRWR